jgi:uroporphyrin-III C-methyltransferase
MRDLTVKGKVFLVGAGPGDPELLTLKAFRLLRTADAVLHDDLVAPEILKLIPPTAQVHDVGKRCGTKRILQGEINCLMVALAASGLRVVRLKGGDPLIFGRAGEEIESLRRNNIPFEIVPGVTSAMGAAAAAQIPLTHRRASDAVVFLTAHRASDADVSDWNKFAGSGATLVIYMPGQNYSDIARRLMAAGLSPQTPCAVVSRATTRYQRTYRSNLAKLPRTPQLVSPTLLIVGEVVALSSPESIAEGLPISQRFQPTASLSPDTVRAHSVANVLVPKQGAEVAV